MGIVVYHNGKITGRKAKFLRNKHELIKPRDHKPNSQVHCTTRDSFVCSNIKEIV